MANRTRIEGGGNVLMILLRSITYDRQAGCKIIVDVLYITISFENQVRRVPLVVTIS